MKLSSLPVSLYADPAAPRDLGDWLRIAEAAGLDGADLSVVQIGDRREAGLDSLRRQAADVGLSLVMLATYSDFTHPSAGERVRQHEDVKRWIDAASRMGVEFLRLTAGQAHPGVPEDVGLGWAADGLTAQIERAARAGVRLLYENHVRGVVWTHHDFTQPAARFLEVVRRTAGSGLEILFDTANCSALGEDTLAVLDEVRDRVAAIHMSDIRRRGAFEPTTIGTGVAPIHDVFRRMVVQGFDGWISIEEASRTGDQAFAASVAVADRAWIDAGGRPRQTTISEDGGKRP